MTVVKLRHWDWWQHQASIFKQLHRFRQEGQLCDIVLKSRDGTEHGAHKAVLCAASENLRSMLVGPFREANQVQQGQPVEMTASNAVVFALLEYIYGEQPHVELEDSLELLRLADAYNFTDLASAIEAGLRASLDSAPVTTALKVLQQTQGMHDLQDACEDKVAANFEPCIELVDFLELSAGQLGSILRRADLRVSREEVVVKGLFQWFNRSKERAVQLGLLLQTVDFQSISSDNLVRLQHFSASMGPVGYDLQREVGRALQFHQKRSAANTPHRFRPKRRCLQNWSPDLGASSHGPRQVTHFAVSLCSHDGAIFYSQPVSEPRGSQIWHWNPEDNESHVFIGTEVDGVNDLGFVCKLSVSPEGTIFVADQCNNRLLSFENRYGKVLLTDVDVSAVSCSPNGCVYVLTQNGHTVEKLVGETLHPLISNQHLPTALQFGAEYLFVTKDEVIYISDCRKGRILRLNPGEAEPVVVGEAPNKEHSNLKGLFVTGDNKVYVADLKQWKVWAFHHGDAAFTEVLTCPGKLTPMNLLVQDNSLYINMVGYEGGVQGIYQCSLPPKLQLG